MSAAVAADQAIDAALQVVTGLPVFITGSSVAAVMYEDRVGLHAYSDVDLFCSSQNTLIAAAQRLQSAGFEIHERHQRVWERWLELDFNKWHTNSLKLERGGIEVNCIYKLVDGHPTTSLAQVIESFDFGLLATGIDARDGEMRDMRSYFFPGYNTRGALPLLPIRQRSWRRGLISRYQGLREAGRYAKYHGYGYDLSMVKPDLLEGYAAASVYLIDKGDVEKVQLGEIYQSIAIAIEDDEFDKLAEMDRELIYLDDLDKIMEALE
jgi:hypothetical protein